MNLVRALIASAIVATPLLVAAPSANACSCGPPPTDPVAVRRSDAVFSGRVTDQAGPLFSGGENGFGLDVETAYKGTVYETQWVFSNTQGPACGINLTLGKRYIVFAHGEDASRLNTSICSNTRTIDEQPDLEAAGVVLPGRSRATPPSPFLALLTIGVGIAAYRLGRKHRPSAGETMSRRSRFR